MREAAAAIWVGRRRRRPARRWNERLVEVGRPRRRSDRRRRHGLRRWQRRSRCRHRRRRRSDRRRHRWRSAEAPQWMRRRVLRAAPGGVQPGGGTNALLGSTGRDGAAVRWCQRRDLTRRRCWRRGWHRSRIEAAVTDGVGGRTAADATTDAALCPGGVQPGGGTNALLGSTGRDGGADTGCRRRRRCHRGNDDR